MLHKKKRLCEFVCLSCLLLIGRWKQKKVSHENVSPPVKPDLHISHMQKMFHFQQEKIEPSPFFDEAPEDSTTDEERVGRSAELEDSETEHPNSEYYKEWILQNLG